MIFIIRKLDTEELLRIMRTPQVDIETRNIIKPLIIELNLTLDTEKTLQVDIEVLLLVEILTVQVYPGEIDTKMKVDIGMLNLELRREERLNVLPHPRGETGVQDPEDRPHTVRPQKVVLLHAQEVPGKDQEVDPLLLFQSPELLPQNMKGTTCGTFKIFLNKNNNLFFTTLL